MKLLSTFIAIISLSVVGCGTSPPPSTPDTALRKLLGVKTITATYRLPPDEDYYRIRILQFEDGKAIAHGGSMGPGAHPHSGSRIFQIQLLWGEIGGQPKLALSQDDSAMITNGEFWQKLDGGTTSFLIERTQIDYDGYRLLGFAQSYLEQGGKKLAVDSNGIRESPVSYVGFEEALRKKKYVGALGVRTFKTKEEADKAWEE